MGMGRILDQNYTWLKSTSYSPFHNHYLLAFNLTPHSLNSSLTLPIISLSFSFIHFLLCHFLCIPSSVPTMSLLHLLFFLLSISTVSHCISSAFFSLLRSTVCSPSWLSVMHVTSIGKLVDVVTLTNVALFSLHNCCWAVKKKFKKRIFGLPIYIHWGIYVGCC